MNHLKWMGHQSTIYDLQKHLRDDPMSCDVAIIGRGMSVRAHRFILSSCSDLLRNILAELPNGQEATILVPDIKGFLLESILAFIYMGETYINSNNLSEFLEAINHLGIKSAISFECNTGLAASVNNGGVASLKTIGEIQINQDEIIEEEQISLPKIEEQSVIDGSAQPTARELEFLDVYNEQQQKITYSIENMTATTSNEFILTENSGTFTLTQNTKQSKEVATVTEKEAEGDTDESADDHQIMEEYTATTEPLIEIAPAPDSVTNASISRNFVSNKTKMKMEDGSSQEHVSMIEEAECTAATMSILGASNESSSTFLRDESLDMAVQGVLEAGMSLQKAAQKYHISKTVLWRRLRKHPLYMKTNRENPILEAACNRLKSGESLKMISQALDIPMSTLHRYKVRLAQQGRLPEYITFKKRGSFSKEQLKEKLSKAVQACVHEGMSQNHAANLYEIPKSTLWRHLQKRMNEAQIQCLDDDESIKEEIILS